MQPGPDQIRQDGGEADPGACPGGEPAQGHGGEGQHHQEQHGVMEQDDGDRGVQPAQQQARPARSPLHGRLCRAGWRRGSGRFRDSDPAGQQGHANARHDGEQGRGTPGESQCHEGGFARLPGRTGGRCGWTSCPAAPPRGPHRCPSDAFCSLQNRLTGPARLRPAAGVRLSQSQLQQVTFYPWQTLIFVPVRLGPW